MENYKMADSIEIYVVDAFTDEAFTGNPAAVTCLEQDIPDDLKKKIAAEMNLSETAFITLSATDDQSLNFKSANSFNLRWFTPEQEVDLCGHATLASAAVIFQTLGNKSKEISFNTRSGILKAVADEEGTSITLDFPLNPPISYEAPNLQDMIKVAVGSLEVEDAQLSPTTKKLIIRLADKYTRQDLESIRPATQNMLSVENSGAVRGVIVTLRGSDGYDFYSRYFAPWVGIPEDPVTGSAHTVLAPYWEKVLQKTQFRVRQCSKRGGDLVVKIVGQRVELTGRVAHVLSGKIRIR